MSPCPKLYSGNAALPERGGMFKKISNTEYVFRVSARTIKGPRSARVIKKCTCDRDAKRIAEGIKAELQNRAERSLKSKKLELIVNRYRQDNPGAKWGTDRFDVAIKWAGHLEVDETLRQSFAEVVNRFKGTPTRYKTLPSASTTNKLIGLAKAAVFHCFDIGLIEKDFLHRFRKEPENNERTAYLAPEEVSEILSGMTATFRPVAEFAYWNATRQEELLKCQRSDIDFERMVLVLRPEYTKGAKGIQIGREVPIPEHFAAYFRHGEGKSDYAFYVRGTGEKIQRRQLCQDWTRACKKAGKEAHLHDLRGSRGTDLIDAGWAIKDVMTLMGHRTMGMFLRYQKAKKQGELFASIRSSSFSTTFLVSQRDTNALKERAA
jgi:integrase